MTRFSLGDWKEDSVGVFVDGQQVARLVNTGWPGQSQLPMDLLNLIRHGTPTVPDELQTFDVTFAVCVDSVDAETAVEDARKLVSNPTWKASKVVQLSNVRAEREGKK